MINREHFADCSDNEKFAFSLICANCGFVYKSTPVYYSTDKKREDSSNADYGLHQTEYSKAFDLANEGASKLFKSCQLCENTVCNDCAVLMGDKFLCKQCKEKLIAEVYNSSSETELPRCVMFNRFVMPILKNVSYYFDGERGRRIAFLEDNFKSFLISFEENMKCIDLAPDSVYKEKDEKHEYRNGNKYLHQRKTVLSHESGDKRFVFFHMEFTDEDGAQTILPGQMNVSEGYNWSEGVEPVLKELLDSIEVC